MKPVSGETNHDRNLQFMLGMRVAHVDRQPRTIKNPSFHPEILGAACLLGKVTKCRSGVAILIFWEGQLSKAFASLTKPCLPSDSASTASLLVNAALLEDAFSAACKHSRVPQKEQTRQDLLDFLLHAAEICQHCHW